MSLGIRAGFATVAWISKAPLSWGLQISMICSTQAEHCNLVATVFARSSGIKVSFAHKGTACTQIATLDSMRLIKGSAIWKRRKNQEINGSPKS